MEFLIPFLTVIVLCIAAYTDLKDRIIPNWLVLPGIVLLFCLNFVVNDNALKWTFFVGIIPAAAMFLTSLFRKDFGGGDVKLALLIGLALGGIAPIMILIGTFIAMVLFKVLQLFVRIGSERLPMAPFYLVATLGLFALHAAGVIRVVGSV